MQGESRVERHGLFVEAERLRRWGPRGPRFEGFRLQKGVVSGEVLRGLLRSRFCSPAPNSRPSAWATREAISDCTWKTSVRAASKG